MPIEAPPVQAISTERFLDLDIAILSAGDMLAEIQRLARQPGFSYIVTPNVDHFVALSRTEPRDVSDAFRAAYAAATVRLCDSRVIARLARFCGIALPVHPGSDLTASLFAQVFSRDDHIAVIGGKADTISRLQHIWPAPRYSQHMPPMGILKNPGAMAAAQAFVSETGAHYTLFAIGSPQSEILAHRCVQNEGARGVGLCIGASIDFLLGDQVRAPRWMQRAGLEWAHRLGSHPKRLARRYLIEGPKIFPIVIKWWYKNRYGVSSRS
jgi:N-acetylglucosaminyldiphosphoundecaprenol N-acetyl-beta-D-mannosaminyltransferase